MAVVWKFTLGLSDYQVIAMPTGAKVVHVGMQNGSVTLWAWIDQIAQIEARLFVVVGTGGAAPERSQAIHLGTVFDGPFVWHVFERTGDQLALGSHERPIRGASDDWLTPPYIISALGPFDLDPCASQDQPWSTASCQYSTPFYDGLFCQWFGFVWCNPPFSENEKWLTKLADHGNGIALTPARTETRWFINTIWSRADAILFLHRRPRFHYPVTGEIAKGNAGAPIVLVAYGGLAVERLKGCGLEGSLVRYWRQSTSLTSIGIGA